ncbi:MAG: hypothetical protein V3U86_09175 [Acidobacteriota bacterium]|nr:hypothetical protein [Acidobacteriota bacterium]
MLIPTALLLAGATSSLPRAASLPPDPQREFTPHLKIFADRYVALAPARVRVYAQLGGVDDDDVRFCHAGETWITGKVEGTSTLNSISKHDPRCVHDPKKLSVSRSFTKDYEFSRPGSYVCRLVVHSNDGRIVQSNMIVINVR